MIQYSKHILSNGLRVILHEDHTLPTAVLNILYDVGARDENPEKTGFAHLFEHLMFGGSVNIPDFDLPLQRVGGVNNAFTSNDITNYYDQLPSNNIETAFWLESDRMLSLAFSEKSLDVQRNVVMEEFKQRYLNQPYGDTQLRLRPLVYKDHPYRWSTIGKELKHIEDVEMGDVKAFFKKHYNPLNAILVIAGDVDTTAMLVMAEKWFGSIPSGEKYTRNLPVERRQEGRREETVHADVPLNAIYMAYRVVARNDPGYYAAELLADILSQGNSSRLYTELVKNKNLFSDIHASLSQDLDPGMLIIEGKVRTGVEIKDAEAAVLAELQKLVTGTAEEFELTKVLNKLESGMVFSELNLLDRALNLAYFELLGDASQVNHQLEKYAAVTIQDIQKSAIEIFDAGQSSVLYYLKAEGAPVEDEPAETAETTA